MINLYVVVVGLFAIVPPVNTGDPVTALLLRLDQPLMLPSGDHIPIHHAIGFFRPKGYAADEKVEWFLNGEDIQIVDATGSPTFRKEDFLELAKVVDPQPAKLQSGCNTANHAAVCRVNGLPAIAARVLFLGGAVSPLKVVDRDLGSGVITIEARPFDGFDFRTLTNPILRSKHVKVAPTALLYAVMVDPAQAAIDVGGTKIPLDLAEVAKCRELGAEDTCIIVTVMNSSLPEPKTTEGQIEGLIATSESEPPDPHFDPFYGLLADRQVPHYLPHRIMRKAKPESDPPEARCIPPVIEQ